MKPLSCKLVIILLTLLLPGSALFSQEIPERPVPPRLVNDFAGLLSTGEVNALEKKLVAFNDSTSTQLTVVIVKDLSGYDKSDYAQRLGEKWGVGQKGLDNGIVILLKPKTPESRGEVFIAPGYGLEGAIPDLVCADIIDREMLPAFRQGDYYRGLDRAVDVLMALASGEYSSDDYRKKSGGNPETIPGIILIIVVVTLYFIINSGRSNHNNISRRGSDLPFWLLLSMMNSGLSHRGSWGGFSGGDRGGGGFGGFGGGSFGGGGAGGSW